MNQQGSLAEDEVHYVAVTRFRLEKAFFAVAGFSTIQRHSSPARSA
jgi:hypothetical protein